MPLPQSHPPALIFPAESLPYHPEMAAISSLRTSLLMSPVFVFAHTGPVVVDTVGCAVLTPGCIFIILADSARCRGQAGPCS